MNLSRDKAIEAMDSLTEAGYTANVEAAVIGHDPKPLYRVCAPALTHDTVALRELCDLAESLGLTAVLSFQQIRFEEPDARGPR